MVLLLLHCAAGLTTAPEAQARSSGTSLSVAVSEGSPGRRCHPWHPSVVPHQVCSCIQQLTELG